MSHEDSLHPGLSSWCSLSRALVGDHIGQMFCQVTPMQSRPNRENVTLQHCQISASVLLASTFQNPFVDSSSIALESGEGSLDVFLGPHHSWELCQLEARGHMATLLAWSYRLEGWDSGWQRGRTVQQLESLNSRLIPDQQAVCHVGPSASHLNAPPRFSYNIYKSNMILIMYQLAVRKKLGHVYV